MGLEYFKKQRTTNRSAIAAGRFYSDNKKALWEELQTLFTGATAKIPGVVQAIISPHAGYVFSGETAVNSFNQIDREKAYDHIFLIGSSHHIAQPGASIYAAGNYITPLGEVKVDTDFCKDLIEQNRIFHFIPEAHSEEHSLEVQLPFLQFILKDKKFNIVPIIITTQQPDDCEAIANALRPWFNSDNLFIISSDFSHYPSYQDACDIDKLTAASLQLNSPQQFLNCIEANAKKNIHGLKTSACGWTSLLTLLYLSQKATQLTYHLLSYANSGDNKQYGDKDQVVGYHAIALAGQTNCAKVFDLESADRETLIQLARNSLTAYVENRIELELTSNDFNPILNTNCGAFVTLRSGKKLRGCLGRFATEEPLWKVVQDMACSVACNDTRFNPVQASELENISIEISVLTPMRKIESIDEIIPGKHGIYVKKGLFSGTYLPQVATDTGWDALEMLRHCSHDKAGMGWDGWKDADIFIYEAIIIEE